MSDSKHPHDDALRKILHKHHAPFQELNFLNSVFGFLNRHSKYLSNPGASKKVISLVHSYIDKAKNREINELTQNNNDNNNNNSTQEPSHSQEEKKKEKEKEKEKSEKSTNLNNNKIIDSNANKNTNNVANNNNSSSSDSKTHEISVSTDDDILKPTTEQNNNLNQSQTEEDDIKDRPIGNGGKTDRYVWTQTLNEVELSIQIPSNIRTKDLDIITSPKKLKISYKNSSTAPIIDNEFHDEINVDDTTWVMDSSSNYKTLTFVIQKKKGMNWWKRVFVGDPEIDTQKIEPENSKLQDLDPETRKTVEQMMFDQKQKMKGLPTSKEQEQQAILEKFKSQHPEMDFSKAKFG